MVDIKKFHRNMYYNRHNLVTVLYVYRNFVKTVLLSDVFSIIQSIMV